MNAKMLLTACFLLCAAVFVVANAAIARECYDKNTDFAKSKKNNNNFLLGGLITGPICILCAFGMMAAATRIP
jgi:hypothetical protein